MALLGSGAAELPSVCMLMCLLDGHLERVTKEGKGARHSSLRMCTVKYPPRPHVGVDSQASAHWIQSRASVCGHVTVPVIHAPHTPSALELCVSSSVEKIIFVQKRFCKAHTA